MTPKKRAFENIFEKGENAGNQYFLPFPKMFLFYPFNDTLHILSHQRVP